MDYTERKLQREAAELRQCARRLTRDLEQVGCVVAMMSVLIICSLLLAGAPLIAVCAVALLGLFGAIAGWLGWRGGRQMDQAYKLKRK